MRVWGPKRREPSSVLGRRENMGRAQGGKHVRSGKAGEGARRKRRKGKNGSWCKEWARRLGELLELRTQGRQGRSWGAWEAITRAGVWPESHGSHWKIQGGEIAKSVLYLDKAHFVTIYVYIYIYTNFTRLLLSQWLLFRLSMPTWVVKQFLLETNKKL